MQTENSNFNVFEPVSDIISTLQNIASQLSRSQVIIPILETPYSTLPNIDRSTVEPECQSVINTIAERQQQLDAVLHEISGLEIVMDSIMNLHQQAVDEKQKVTESMSLHKGFVSGLWRLPTRVLSNIFTHCLSTTLSLPSISKAPLLLTRICRRWREVAVGTPDLWCGMSAKADHRDWKRAAFGYNLWLKRSQGRPLSLATLGYRRSIKLQSFLQPYLTRITSLRVHIHEFPDLPVADLIVLQELNVGGMKNADIPNIVQSISQLPSTMRSLNVIDMTSSLDIKDLSPFWPVWAHLTDVQISVRDPNVVVHVLQLCPNLSYLIVRVEFDRRPLKSFAHTKLQFLGVLYPALFKRLLPGLLNALSLPNLRSLEVECRNHSLPHEDMKAWLAQSKCPLETLTVCGQLTVTDAQQAEYVSIIPSLKVLRSYRILC
ncbi:uncharacterized protein EDB93DRAFT_1244606 [Suillus bovinus]|uniref:uncharacterized protein n=1 Tax=Suillus bovinus TaxID=48563 RepID=UPI001B8655D8|nr:uncharacterized protein EDB93DRAFT_1244606 [Suillus bovinus]KAG2159830.1 hypothetical protein EDB93DRAFT_1244606 [Suillus bovinus]